ncbi:hypothetical protein M422DRAFT_49484 [Sphaerobolus stellatus SS14]|uniref:Uncharacterized protein n=1 Tax=Sphaerobolus stellatus (strain SS14) TaxID=990650 RepID=A0A0C9VPJ2_SPHS4|nr:hypothetical protein M422DRAFT_49484 [Sphaerobolus stellatus SS14]
MEGDADHEDPEDHMEIDALLTQAWNQFLLDVTETAPNQKSALKPSYCRFSLEECSKVDESMYSNLCLSNYFTNCLWRIGDTEDWDLAFKWLFPPKDILHLQSTQNYRSTKYLKLWNKIKEWSTEKLFKHSRLEIKKRFKKLKWIPAAKSDRIWKCVRKSTGYTPFGGGDGRPGPLVLVCEWLAW